MRRVGDLKGPGSKVNDVLQELFPTIDVENVPGELLFLMSTKIGWAATSKAPTAGKLAGIQLFNPVGSGHLITVSSVDIASASDNLVTYGFRNVAIGTSTATPRQRDGRGGTGPSGVADLRASGNEIALVNGEFRMLASTTHTLEDPNSVCVLSPGIGLTFIGSIDVVFSCSFNYRERVAEPSELNF